MHPLNLECAPNVPPACAFGTFRDVLGTREATVVNWGVSVRELVGRLFLFRGSSPECGFHRLGTCCSIPLIASCEELLRSLAFLSDYGKYRLACILFPRGIKKQNELHYSLVGKIYLLFFFTARDRGCMFRQTCGNGNGFHFGDSESV